MDTDGREVQIGGETISAKDDYLRTITNLMYKINSAADSMSRSDLQWKLNYYTDMLIAAILDRGTRATMKQIKEDVYKAEVLKLQSFKGSKNLSADEEDQAKITACTVIVGECREYMDRYFGFEMKLAVML